MIYLANIWWSSLKKSIEQHFCEPLQSRVQIHKTLYRGSHNGCQFDAGAGRFWILVDREQIFSASDKDFWNQVVPLREELCRSTDSVRSGDEGWHNAQEQAKGIVHAKGIYSHYECHDALKEFLSLSIEDAIASSNKLIKALAMLDKRLGKRKLKKISLIEDEHYLVRHFYNL